MRGFAPNTLISQPERLSRCDFRDCCRCSDGHVDIFSSVSLSENRQAGKISKEYYGTTTRCQTEVQDQLGTCWRLYTILAHLAQHFTFTSIDLEPI